MAEPIKHDALSSTSTAAWETAKGAAKWGLGVPMLVGAAVVGVGAAIAGAGLAGALGWALGGALVGGAAAVTVGAPIAGGLAVLGGLLGLSKGGDRIAKEGQAYRDRVSERAERREHKRENELNTAAMMGMQQGYVQGYQQGQQQIIGHLQEVQQQLEAQQQHAHHHHAHENAPVKTETHSFAAKCEKHEKHESKVAMIEKQREAQTNAGPQIG